MLRWTDKTSIYRCIIIIFFYGVNVNLSEAIRAEINVRRRVLSSMLRSKM